MSARGHSSGGGTGPSRSHQAHNQIKAVSVLAADEALESARQADQELSAGSSEVGPLHGVPITLKDHAIVKGLRTTLGLPQYWNYRLQGL